MPHEPQADRPPSSSGVGLPLFVYGTLRCGPVLRGLIRRVPNGGPDSAPGWRAAALRDRVYPGLVPGRGAAAGRVLTDLAPREWRVLDDFEGEEYALRPLTLASGRRAVAYVWAAGVDVLPSDWDLDDFRRRHLAGYARRLRHADPA